MSSSTYMPQMQQIVAPNTSIEVGAGWCHKLAREVFGAPALPGIGSATKAADITQWRHYEREMPNVAVPVWFDHWGTYQGVFGNWGHVVIWVPGHGFLSSPWYRSFGQEWYPTLESVEATFHSKFRFWSDDINKLRVAEPLPTPNPNPDPLVEIGDEMFIAVVNGAWCLIVPNGSGKPQAVVLGGDSQAHVSGIPVIYFTWEDSIQQLARAVDGLPV